MPRFCREEFAQPAGTVAGGVPWRRGQASWLYRRLRFPAVGPTRVANGVPFGRKSFQGDQVGRRMLRLFWDETGNGFYFTGSDAEVLPVRMREWVDAAIPAGNSVAARNLIQLSQFSGEPRYREYSRLLLTNMAGELKRSPLAYTFLLSACGEYFATAD